MKYLSSQVELKEKIALLVNNDVRSLFIEGEAECGKSYAVHGFMNDLISDESDILNVASQVDLKDIDYYPFSHGLENKDFIDKNKYLISTLDTYSDSKEGNRKLISALISNFLRNSDRKKLRLEGIFNEKELEILSKLETGLKKRKKVIIICSNLQFWDNKSLHLLFKLLEGSSQRFDFLDKSKFIIVNSLTLDQECNPFIEKIKNCCDKEHTMSKFKSNDYKILAENFFYNLALEEQTIAVVSKLANENIPYIKEIFSELSNNFIKDKFSFSKLKRVLEEKFRGFGASRNQINEVLEYASVIGYYFSTVELEKVTKIHKDDFIKIITQANELSLISEKDEDYYSFGLEVIKKIFDSQAENKKYKYYTDLETILKEIRPSQYLRRARYLKKIDAMQASDLFVLAFLKQLREYRSIDSDSRGEIELFTSRDQQVYIINMERAYNAFHEEKYDEAIAILEKITTIASEILKAEIQILLSQCYCKTLDPQKRKKSVECLLPYSDLSTLAEEKDVYERVLQRLLISYVHINENDMALRIEGILKKSLAGRASIDEQARYTINNLNRISNSIHEPEAASHMMLGSVEFYQPSVEGDIPSSLADYYKALCNYSGIQIICGEFREAFETAVTATEIQEEYDIFPFPRLYLLANNLILSGYFNHKFSIEECVEFFIDVLNGLPIIADRLLIASNLSIFYALKNEYKKAKELLLEEAEKQKMKRDEEGIYDYRVIFNTAIYEFLSGNREKGIQQLSSLKKSDSPTQSDEMLKKQSLLIEKMKVPNKNYSGIEWLHVLKEHYDANFTTTDYFYLGYTFTTLYNWDM
ncbi:hypothetical protein [Enterococcus sp. CWB-B31]|uniref:hypothetical protein n=1 Tax=Enterococcus sp. CWB-B31 TaxID=2885159 RepID=UPI001E2FA06F|nr:hypothetical protein [Enterococcus sp. CWB-B31]MCB5954927.1 hypothetical protein [Enterococcus sp. CWB-B31]